MNKSIDTEVGPVKAGDVVGAFHPRRFGVVNTGRVVKVGSKWLHIDFGTLFGGTYKVAPRDVVRFGSDW